MELDFKYQMGFELLWSFCFQIGCKTYSLVLYTTDVMLSIKLCSNIPYCDLFLLFFLLGITRVNLSSKQICWPYMAACDNAGNASECVRYIDLVQSILMSFVPKSYSWHRMISGQSNLIFISNHTFLLRFSGIYIDRVWLSYNSYFDETQSRQNTWLFINFKVLKVNYLSISAEESLRGWCFEH